MDIKLLLTAVPFLCYAGKSYSVQRNEKPNLLIIMTDQQRYDALGCVGKFPFLKTPNLDRLAKKSAFFTHAYTQCAVSAPARATILTGLTVNNHGQLNNDVGYKDSFGFTNNLSYDQILCKNGYYAEFHGKLHNPSRIASCYANFKKLDLPNGIIEYSGEMKFQEYHDYIKSIYGNLDFEEGDLFDATLGMPYKPDPIDRLFGRGTNSKLTKEEKKIRPLTQPDAHGCLRISKEDTYTAYQAKKVIEALKRAKKVGKPFSITCSFHFPHSPILAAKPYYGMYKPEDMPVPESISDDLKDSPYYKTNGRMVLRQYADSSKIGYMMSTYFGLVTEIDFWVGEILSVLKDLGEEDNTMIIFMSDHGEMLGSHGMREKNVFFEESARIPLMISFPERIKPRIIDNYVSNIDLYATILDYMGIENTQKTDSESLRCLIEGKDNSKGKYLVTEWNFRGPVEPNYMIIKDGWKLYIPYTKESTVKDALYNLNKDPLEMENLLSPTNRDLYKDKAEELKRDLLCWLKRHNPKHVAGVSERIF